MISVRVCARKFSNRISKLRILSVRNVKLGEKKTVSQITPRPSSSVCVASMATVNQLDALSIRRLELFLYICMYIYILIFFSLIPAPLECKQITAYLSLVAWHFHIKSLTQLLFYSKHFWLKYMATERCSHRQASIMEFAFNDSVWVNDCGLFYTSAKYLNVPPNE